MERLIESIREYPCLWKTDEEEYKVIDIKEAAWRQVVKECDLPDVKEAKALWRRLRDGHRQAVSRKITGRATNTEHKWKYEKLMEFLLPTMQTRRRITNDTQDSRQDSDVNSSESEDIDDYVPPKRKSKTTLIEEYNAQKRPEIGFAERDPLSTTSRSTTSSIVENTALEKFFSSMLLTTSSLSETLQLRVQRQVFDVVMEAKEQDLIMHQLKSSPGNSSSA